MEYIVDIGGRVQQFLQRQASNIPSQLDSPTKCKECGDQGYIVETCKDQMGRKSRLARECQCVVEKRVAASLPARYRKASLLDFPEITQTAVLDWLGTPGDGLLLTGAVGRGKTHLAAAITRTLVMIGKDAAFRRCAELYAGVREAYRLNQDERTAVEEYFRTRFLALDDLGAGSLSDHERRVTLDVLDERLNAYLPTIVTTNWTLNDISIRTDDRISSRPSCFQALEMTGTEKRVRQVRGYEDAKGVAGTAAQAATIGVV